MKQTVVKWLLSSTVAEWVVGYDWCCWLGAIASTLMKRNAFTTFVLQYDVSWYIDCLIAGKIPHSKIQSRLMLPYITMIVQMCIICDLVQLTHVRCVDRYHQLLRQARRENFSDLTALRFIYQSGFTKNGETVVIYIARNLPTSPSLADKVKSDMLYVLLVTRSFISIF